MMVRDRFNKLKCSEYLLWKAFARSNWNQKLKNRWRTANAQLDGYKQALRDTNVVEIGWLIYLYDMAYGIDYADREEFEPYRFMWE